MPEYDSVMVAYSAKRDEIQKDLEQLYSEIQTKQTALDKDKSNLTDLMKSIRQQEIVDMQNNFQTIQERAQDELNKFVEDKQAPILKKIRDAIKEVAIENGFTHVLNNSQDQVLYFQDTYDILPLVKAKLNLKDKPVPLNR